MTCSSLNNGRSWFSIFSTLKEVGCILKGTIRTFTNIYMNHADSNKEDTDDTIDHQDILFESARF